MTTLSPNASRALQREAAGQGPEFAAFKGLQVVLPEAAYARPTLLSFHLRHALEAEWLKLHAVTPELAELAAARAASLFVLAEPDLISEADIAVLPSWVNLMAADTPPEIQSLAQNFNASEEALSLIRAYWPLLGTAESLMETGGDMRLLRDPMTGLNGYGCSHRPRPWAVTFASSTASSSSARGYIAADLERLRVTAALLSGCSRRQPVSRSLSRVRSGIAKVLALPKGSQIVLAASGTDTELLALAMTHLREDAGLPITTIILAPEETGRGVPMAARGLHFALDTALGHNVAREAPIAGFRPDTLISKIALRDEAGAVRPHVAVEADISTVMHEAAAVGRRVILHAVDLSKTGLLAPSLQCLNDLRARFGADFDIVVDACQTRLSPGSLAQYLALDAIVLITGSKFFTGPPFAGAAILSASIAKRLNGGVKLPIGLNSYFGRDEFPARCPAAKTMPQIGNYGLGLRWHAALAEARALFRIPPGRRAEILQCFHVVIHQAIAEQPGLRLLPVPALHRHSEQEPWETCQSIFTFSLPHPTHSGGLLDPAEARSVYFWLNTDLSPYLAPKHRGLASLICHIGQPVALPAPSGQGQFGALRVNAGARLISGEPTHRGLSARLRLGREFADLTAVFDKISLILANWDHLTACNPIPRYRPRQYSLTEQNIRSPVAQH